MVLEGAMIMRKILVFLSCLVASQAYAATVIVLSNPKGADVVIDDKPAGKTPFRKSLPEGAHQLTLKKAEYQDLVQTVQVGKKLVVLRLELKPKTYPVDILFKSIGEQTMGWRAYTLGGVDVGGVPGTVELPLGQAKLILAKAGFADVPVVIVVTPDLRICMLDDPKPGTSVLLAKKVPVAQTVVIDFRKPKDIKNLMHQLVFRYEHLWQLYHGEIRGKSGPTDRARDYNYMLLRTQFQEITAVHISGRIIGPVAENFRIGIGPLNATFNWECGKQCHFRDGTRTVRLPRHLLTVGKLFDLLVTQEGKEYVVFVDGQEVFRTRVVLRGTVDVYPGYGSMIGVSLIEVQGVIGADPASRPSHKRW